MKNNQEFEDLKALPHYSLQGGLSSGYKKHVAESGLMDETYTKECVALIKISGTSIHNNKALQVDVVRKEVILCYNKLVHTGLVLRYICIDILKSTK